MGSKLDSAKKLLEKTNKLFSTIETADAGKASNLEMDLMLSNLRSFYDEILELKAELNHTESKSTNFIQDAPPVLEEPAEELIANEKIEAEAPLKKYVLEEEQLVEEEVIAVNAPQFIQAKDIRNLIDINKRFVFTEQLFSRDVNRYENALKAVNETSSNQDLENLLAKFKQENNWEDGAEESVVRLFTKIVGQRFE